ncbi:hypothetical protein CCAND93_270004 [Capnocytophaga canis]|uniref:Uncharacterized protein n=1 Tax=Capnocytophaga canis TaxID=1848903 RepID=A0A0B7IPR5_9FLAO|nr:hypothetical protein CCAND93_270004 [Capnocytophaga canis]
MRKIHQMRKKLKKSFYLYFNNKNLNHVITMLKKYHINKIILFSLCYLCHYFLII